MISDEERREVARRLRERAGKRVLNLSELRWCIGCDDGDDAAAWNRLADLIEPQAERTCRPEVCDDGAGAWGVYCSECSYRFAGPHGKREVSEHMAARRDIMPRYCPSCGARIVDWED